MEMPLGSRKPLPEYQAPQDVEPVADAFTSFTTGIKRQNWASREFSDLFIDEPESYGTDLNYDYSTDEANTDYPSYRMVGARSEAEAAAIRRDLDQELEDLRIINSSGWGTAGEVFGGVFRPEALAAAFVPGGLAATVATEVAAEGMNEVLLHGQQMTRTQAESYMNIGMVGAGTAILGGAAKMISYNDLPVTKALPDEPQAVGTPITASGAPTGGNRSAGAMEAGTTLEQEGMAGGAIAKSLAVGPLKRLLDSDSKVARKAVQQIADSPFFTRANEEGLTQGVSAEALSEAAIGRAASVVEKVKPLYKEASMVSDEFEEAVGIALSNGDKHANPLVQKAAETYRKELIDPILEEAQELGLLPKTKAQLQEEWAAKGIEPDDAMRKQFDEAPDTLAKGAESYFPRVYDSGKIMAKWDLLKKQLTDAFSKEQPDLDPAEMEESVITTMQNMMGGLPVGTKGGSTAMPSPLKARTLALTDDMLEEYRELRAGAVLMKHATGMSPYMAMKRNFGDTTMTDIVRTIQDDYTVLISKAPDAKTKNKLSNKMDRDIKDIQRVADRVLHQVAKEDPSSAFEKATRYAKVYNMTTQLGGIVLSSAPDMARPLMQYGLKSYAVGMKKAFEQLFSNTTTSRAATQRMGIALERTLNQRQLTMVDQMATGDKLSDGAGRLFGKITLFDQWTDIMETVAAHSATDWTLRQAGKLVNGQRLTRSELGKLGRMGLSHDDLKAIYKEAMETGGAKDSVLKYADTIQWKDVQLARKFEAALGGDVRRAIIQVGAGEKPLAMDDGFKSLMFQYMSFAISSTNKMLVAGIQQRDLALATGILANVSLGALVGATKTHLRGGDTDDWEAKNWLYEGIDRSGMLGLYRPALSALQYASGDMPSRYLAREGAIFGGPTMSQITRGIAAGVDISEGDYDKAGKKAMALTPFLSNTLHVRQVLQQLGEN